MNNDHTESNYINKKTDNNLFSIKASDPKQLNRNRNKVLIPFIVFTLILFFCICSCGLLFILFSSTTNTTGFSFSSATINSNIDRIKEEPIVKIRQKEGDSFSMVTNKIAIIDIRNVINYTTNPEDIFIGTNNRSIALQVQKALLDDNVKAVILRLNTPGGAVDAAEPICRDIKKLKNKKPVYAFIDSEGASLGYLIANCTKFIYARPTSITGSIGVRVDILDIVGILENLGAKQITITNTKGNKKSQAGLFDPTSEEYKQIQKILDEVYDYFIQTVWENRSTNASNKLTKEKLISYADGRIFSGKQAYELGLVDKIAEFEDVVNEIIEKEKLIGNIDVVEYNLHLNFFSSLFRSINAISLIFRLHAIENKKVIFLLIADY